MVHKTSNQLRIGLRPLINQIEEHLIRYVGTNKVDQFNGAPITELHAQRQELFAQEDFTIGRFVLGHLNRGHNRAKRIAVRKVRKAQRVATSGGVTQGETEYFQSCG